MGLLLCLVATWSSVWITSFIFTRLPVFNSYLQFKVFDSKSLHEPDHFGNHLKFLGQALFTLVHHIIVNFQPTSTHPLFPCSKVICLSR